MIFISQSSGHGDFRHQNDPNPSLGGRLGAADSSNFSRLGIGIVADGRPAVLAAVRQNLMMGATQIKIMAGGGGSSKYDPIDVAQYTADDFVGSLIVDRAGNIWLGHPGHFPDNLGGGATRYDDKSFKLFTQKDGLSSTTVYGMLEDKTGNIWFGSADGSVCRYDGKTFTDFSETAPSEK